MIGIGSCRKYNLRSPHMTFTSSYAVADMSGSLPSAINQMKKLRQCHLPLVLPVFFKKYLSRIKFSHEKDNNFTCYGNLQIEIAQVRF